MALNNYKISAIICEFNPLHTGHVKLINYAKSISDFVVCIMSGNFTQRGTPACANKYLRASHAIKSGADLVIELPTVFATASAENFAFGGVSLANKIGADYLVFGSECGNVNELYEVAEKLDDTAVNDAIRENVQQGMSYPLAVAKATNSPLLDKPNNTLAIEYLRALKKTHSKITPLTILREDNYNSNTANEYASSSLLRKDKTLREKFLPEFVKQDIDDNVEKKYYDFATTALSLQSKENLKNIEGVSEGIENRIVDATKSDGFDTFIDEVKTKRYTRLRLQRIVLSSLLNVSHQDVENAKQNVSTTVLAVNANSTTLLQLVEESKDEITQRADNLYASLTGYVPPQKLLKISTLI